MLKFFIGQNARTGERAMGGCIYSGELTKLDPFQKGRCHSGGGQSSSGDVVNKVKTVSNRFVIVSNSITIILKI
jgi:hypothetical protein